MRELRHYVLPVLTLALLGGLSAWLQFGLLDPPADELPKAQRDAPDYYVRDLVLTGMDALGKRYELRADRMTHYPFTDRARLDNLHVVQYDRDEDPRHITADTGWLDNATSEVRLSGNVRVVRSRDGADGDAFTGDSMVIILDGDRG